MAKKKITAPLTHNPGKGRPKEHLAYLNWQEMEALRRLNGNNTERGPRGLPSFAEDSASSKGVSRGGQGAVGSGPSRSTGPSRGPTSAPSRTAPSSTSSGPSRGPTGAPSRTAPSSSAGTRSPSGSTAGARQGGGPSGGSLSSPARTAASSGSTMGAARSGPSSSLNAPARTQGSVGSIGGNSDTAARQAAAARDAVKVARESPAFRADAKAGGIKSINVGPVGTPVSIGGNIKGAISQISSQTYSPAKSALSAVTRGPGSVSGMIPGNNDPIAQQRSLQGVTNSFNDTYGTNYTPEQISQFAKAIEGEAAAETPFGRAAVANTMMNRISLAQEDPKKYGYMGGANFDKLLGQYDATGMRPGTTANKVYTSTVPGTVNFQAGLAAINSAMDPMSEFSQTASPKVLNATHYYNPKTASPDWGGKRFEAVGRHVFGNAENISNAVAEARSLGSPSVEPASTQGVSKSIYDRVGNIEGFEGKLTPEKISRMAPEDQDKINEYLQTQRYTPSLSQVSYRPEDSVRPPEKNYRIGEMQDYPRFVDEGPTESIQKQEKTNRRGIGFMEKAPIIGPVLRAGERVYEKITGNDIADAATQKKYEYLQSSPEKQAQMRNSDPSIRRFAASIGQTTEPGKVQSAGGKDNVRFSGIGGLGGVAERPNRTSIGTSATTAKKEPSGFGDRPYKYYQWDVGINIPTPDDPDYNDYMAYLAKRRTDYG